MEMESVKNKTTYEKLAGRLLMRKFLLFILAMTIAAFAVAQSAVSKAETIDYIKKRVTETRGYQLIWEDGTTHFINDVYFSETSATYENGKYNMRYNYKDNSWYYNSYSFKPEFIISVTEGSSNTASNSSVGFIAIKFSNTLVKKKVLYYYHNGSNFVNDYGFSSKEQENKNVDIVFLPYLKQDPTAFERIKKAIMHLKELCKSNDPFAN
jgi:hypothetical protein